MLVQVPDGAEFSSEQFDRGKSKSASLRDILDRRRMNGEHFKNILAFH